MFTKAILCLRTDTHSHRSKDNDKAFSLLHPYHLALCLAYSMCATNTCGMNECS